MAKRQTDVGGYLAAGLLGAWAGAATVVLVTNAVPKMMRRMMGL